MQIYHCSKADVSSVSPSSDTTSLLGQFTSSTQLILIPPPPTLSSTQHQSYLETYAFSHPLLNLWILVARIFIKLVIARGQIVPNHGLPNAGLV